MKYSRTKLNRQRAKWAELGLIAFAKQVFGNPEAEDPETVIGDFMADLMHYCEQKKLDFDMLLARGRDHFIAEYEGKEL